MQVSSTLSRDAVKELCTQLLGPDFKSIKETPTYRSVTESFYYVPNDLTGYLDIGKGERCNGSDNYSRDFVISVCRNQTNGVIGRIEMTVEYTPDTLLTEAYRPVGTFTMKKPTELKDLWPVFLDG